MASNYRMLECFGMIQIAEQIEKKVKEAKTKEEMEESILRITRIMKRVAYEGL